MNKVVTKSRIAWVFFFALISLLVFSVWRRGKPQPQLIRYQCKEIKSAIQQYYSEIGGFPYSLEDAKPVDFALILPLINKNPRGIKYFRAEKVHHPFGEIYQVYMDNDFDYEVNVDGRIYKETEVVVTTLDMHGQLITSEDKK